MEETSEGCQDFMSCSADDDDDDDSECQSAKKVSVKLMFPGTSHNFPSFYKHTGLLKSCSWL
jgi:hypothetical protein